MITEKELAKKLRLLIDNGRAFDVIDELIELAETDYTARIVLEVVVSESAPKRWINLMDWIKGVENE